MLWGLNLDNELFRQKSEASALTWQLFATQLIQYPKISISGKDRHGLSWASTYISGGG